MGPTYAGVLGLLAFCVAIARGVLYRGGAESVLLRAGLSMVAFAIVGFVAGRLAEWIIEQSVHAQSEAAQKKAGTT